MIGLIPRPFIDELLNRTDIVEFIDAYVPLKKVGASHVACCPFHNEKTPSFHVVPKKQFYYCFGCGASGNIISFSMNYLHMSFSDAVESLATRLGMHVPREGRTKNNQPSLSLYQFLNQVALFYQNTLKTAGVEAIQYLKHRKVSGEIAHRYQLGYAPMGWHTLASQFKQNINELIATGMLISKEDGKTYDRYRQRIIYPIHDRHGRIIGFGGRAIEETQQPKYLNSPETIIFQKNRELYGLHQVLQQQDKVDQILIVEGYMDVIALAQSGIVNAVATLGTATSTYHIQLLSKYTQRITFCFDGDPAGRKAAWRALESSLPYLNSGLDAGFIFLPEHHDPDSLVREEGKELFIKRLENATPLHRFFIETLTQNIDGSSLSGKSQLVNTAKPYLLKMSDGPYRQLLINELARLTRIEAHRIHQMLEEKSAPPLSNTNKSITRSPIRIAIAILLQHPEIYSACAKQIDPIMLHLHQHRVLRTLMKQVRESEGINTAKLIELWRDSPLFESMTKLAAWEHQVPEDALTKEFIDIILFLEKKASESNIALLMKKAQSHGLTEAERIKLQQMLKNRHQHSFDKN
jgi:DNA primase